MWVTDNSSTLTLHLSVWHLFKSGYIYCFVNVQMTCNSINKEFDKVVPNYFCQCIDVDTEK